MYVCFAVCSQLYHIIIPLKTPTKTGKISFLVAGRPRRNLDFGLTYGIIKFMKKVFRKIFGGLNITWPKLIIFAVIMGLYTALMAMLVPDGNSFHDIAVTPEWWVLPAIIIIVNSKKPLDAALKTFVFFLISQPLVYLFQVPFNSMGFGLFGYYKYWFLITLLTFPGAFVGWFVKKDQWYSALILSVMTVYLAYAGFNYAVNLPEHFPNHLLSTIYCFGIIPVFIFAIFKDKITRIIGIVLPILSLVIFAFVIGASEPYEIWDSTFLEENGIVLTSDDPYISFYTGEDQGSVELIPNDEGYTIKLTGIKGKKYQFSITDDEAVYAFEFYYDSASQSMIIEKIE